MKIQVILGSTRPGRLGKRVADWATEAASGMPDFDVELVDLADYNLPHFNEAISPRFNPSRKPEAEVARWLAKIAEADGYVFVTPEYNHSFPGILKDALDFADFQFVKKPAAIVSYGTVGGARAAEQLKLVLVEVKAAVVPEATTVTGLANLIDENGKYLGDTSTYGAHVALNTTLTELAWWTKTLTAGRTQLARSAK